MRSHAGNSIGGLIAGTGKAAQLSPLLYYCPLLMLPRLWKLNELRKNYCEGILNGCHILHNDVRNSAPTGPQNRTCCVAFLEKISETSDSL